MRTAALRNSLLGVLLLAVLAALLIGWLQLTHLVFLISVGITVSFVPMVYMLWNAWHQTSPDSLGARGFRPESIWDDNPMDPGLRRDAVAIIPAFGRRGISNRPIRRPAAASAASGVSAASALGSFTRRDPAAGNGHSDGRRGVAAGKGRTDRRPGLAAGKGRADRRRGRLSADAEVMFADERAASGIDDVLTAFDRDLVGLVPVKQRMEEIALLLLVDQARLRFGLEAPRPNLHMCFTGPPGTGKTTVALRMAEMLARLGYLETGQLVHVMRDDLVGEYIGHTAPKTKRVLERAMGGVLFIDEAYYLYRGADSKDYGQEVIDILLQVMENQRDRLVVIVAGYKDRMDDFFESNPGMHSRIAHHLDFAAYDVDELVAIGRLMLDQASYYLSPDAEAAFRKYLSRQMNQPRFANARSVRNELESARLRHARRLATKVDQRWNRDDLMRLEPWDVLPGWDLLTRDPP
jgi:probable Rubsico expression protein CbbX